MSMMCTDVHCEDIFRLCICVSSRLSVSPLLFFRLVYGDAGCVRTCVYLCMHVYYECGDAVSTFVS